MKQGSKNVDPGTLFEYRVARLRYVQGSFVRRSIGVWSPASGDNRQLAELDCFIVTFDPQLRKSVEIVECKTGAGASREIDRLLWLVGIRELANASSVSFAKVDVSEPTRQLAKQLGVSVLDLASIIETESELGISNDWWPGFHRPEFGEAVVKRARVAINGSRQLQGAGKFLFGSYWFMDDFTRIKQLRRLFRLLIDKESDTPDEAFSLLLAEATVLLTLTAVSVASWRGQLAEEEFRALVTEELSTGLGDPRRLRSLLRRVDELYRDQIETIHNAYEKAVGKRVPVIVPSFETQVLTPPEWTDAFADLSLRLWRRSDIATDLIRWMDLWASKLVGAQADTAAPHHLFRSTPKELESAANLVFIFLRRFWNVPEHVFADALDIHSRTGQPSSAISSPECANNTVDNNRESSMQTPDASSDVSASAQTVDHADPADQTERSAGS